MKRKKVLSLLMSATLIISAVALPMGTVSAEDNGSGAQMSAQANSSGTIYTEKGEFKWTLNSSGTFKVTGKGALVLDEYEVDNAFTEIKKIIVGEGITSFELDGSLPNLKELSLPSTLTTIKGSPRNIRNLAVVSGGSKVSNVAPNLFQSTLWMQKNGLVTLGKVCLKYNGNDTAVTLPSGITKIGESAFARTNIQSITLPSSLTMIGVSAFSNCNSLSKVNGGSNVTTVERNAFYMTPWLEQQSGEVILGKTLVRYKGNAVKYTIPKKVESIGEGAFADNNTLETVKFDSNVKKISRYAFANCSKLKSISMPNTVTSIEYGAFDTCISLPNVKLPSSLKKIDVGAFSCCESLTNVSVNKNGYNTILKTIENGAFAGCTSLKKLIIPVGVSKVGTYSYGYDYNPEGGWQQPYKKINGTKIYGTKGTEAQFYATANGIAFSSNTTLKPPTKKPTLNKAKYIISEWRTRIEYTKVTGADGYEIYQGVTSYNGNTEWERVKRVGAKTLKTYVNLTDQNCKYKVRAYKKYKTAYLYGPFSSYKTVK